MGKNIFLFIVFIGMLFIKNNIKTQIVVDEFRIGTSFDRSAEGKKRSEPWLIGLNTRIEKENDEKGGIRGKQIKFNILNDEYNPKKARKNIEELKDKQKTKIILSALGGDNLYEYKDLIENGNILAAFPLDATPRLRNQKYKNAIFLRATYESEIKGLALYAVNNLNAKKIAFFAEIDEPADLEVAKLLSQKYGFANMSKKYDFDLTEKIKENFRDEITKEGLEKVIKKHGFEILEENTSSKESEKSCINVWIARKGEERSSVEVSEVMKKAKEAIEKFNPDSIIFITITSQAQELIKKLTPVFFVGKNLLGISDYTEKPFQKFLKDNFSGKKFIISNVMPNPNTSDLEIVKEFREEMKKREKVINDLSLEGYISASLLIYLTNQIPKDEEITIDKIVEQFDKVKNTEYKGFKLNFDPKTREIAKNVWLNTGEGDWILQSIEEDKPVDIEKKE